MNNTTIIYGPTSSSQDVSIDLRNLEEELKEFGPFVKSLSLEPGYNEDLKYFEKEVIPKLNRVFHESIVKKIMGVELIYWYFPDEILLSSEYLIRLVKKLFNDIKVIAIGPEINHEKIRRLIRNGIIDAGALSIDVKTLGEVREWFANPDDEKVPKNVLVKNKMGIIKFNKPSNSIKDDGYKVLLLPPAWNNDYPPYGLAHISGALKQEGHQVRCLDYNARFWDKLIDKYGHCADYEHMQIWTDRDRYNKKAKKDVEEIFYQVFEEIDKFKPEAIGLSVFETNIISTADFLRVLKDRYPTIKTFIGGPSVTNKLGHEMIRSKYIDAAVMGEGEFTTIELIERWKDKQVFKPLPGALLSHEGKAVSSEGRDLAPIDTIPMPDFSEFDLYNYSEFMLPIFLSRGCVAKCSFCYETQYWKKFRIKTPEMAFEELKKSYDLYGINQFRINDSLMNGSHRLLEEFTDLIIESGLKINYAGYCRLDPKLNSRILNKMAQSGCKEISFGMESASQKVVDNMKKEVDVNDYEKIIHDTYSAGINVMICIMIGFPGEGWREYFQTMLKIIRLRKYIHQLNLSIFIPGDGTPIWENSEHYQIELYDTQSGSWKSKDGKNTHKVRVFRYKLFKKIWFLLKGRKDSLYKWAYELAKEPAI